ncbi:MAG: tetratricopeptide repeat protein, partial [Paracoccaceae bacterium]
MGVLGSCLRIYGDIDESLKFLNKAIKLRPNYAEVFINRGLIRLAQKDKLNALSDLEKAHQLKPHIKDIWHIILSLKMEFKKFEDIILISERMIEIDPADAKIFTIIA